MNSTELERIATLEAKVKAIEYSMKEIIVDGVTGYCVDPYDGDEFRERLLYLIDNPDIGQKMGEAGRKVCEKKFTWDNHVRQLLDLVEHR